MLHLIKLAVGVVDLDDLQARMENRRDGRSLVCIFTRNIPKRASEILGGGSLYWVVNGLIAAKQKVADIKEDKYQDGTKCARIDLEAELFRVAPRQMKPFRGWRYLENDRVPSELAVEKAMEGVEMLPPNLVEALKELCLI